jgi:16S rRNA processing protein RimM
MPVQYDSQSGSEATSEPRYLTIGRITRPHGVRGEVRVEPRTDLPERFAWLERIYVGDGTPVAMTVERVRLHQGVVILKLGSCDTRNDAEALRGRWVLVPAEEAIPLEEGELFLYQLVDMEVVTAEGETLGKVEDVLQTGANDVLVVRIQDEPPKQLLLPDIPDVVLEVDLEAGRIVVQVPPGLVEG